LLHPAKEFALQAAPAKSGNAKDIDPNAWRRRPQSYRATAVQRSRERRCFRVFSFSPRFRHWPIGSLRSSAQHAGGHMPYCTVRYHVRLVPTHPEDDALNAIGIFKEERVVDEVGEPGQLVWRRLDTFSGPAGSSIKAMVTTGNAWHMDVQERIDPLEWDS
jgi:hypothetical protein